MESSCEQEVIRIHQFFVDWLNGTIPNNFDIFQQQCGSILASDLHYIKPNGTVVQHDALVQQLRQGHGTKQGRFFDMEIHNLQVLPHHGDVCLVLYQEWHYGQKQDDNDDNASSLLNDKRQCTALFRRSTDTPNGVEWIHIHETSIL